MPQPPPASPHAEPPRKRSAGTPPPAGGRPARCAWDKLAIAALVLTALAATFTYEQDFDAFWHVASGRWMLQNQRVLDFDPFSTQPEEHQWVDVYWLFQLVMAALQSIAGWPALTVLQSLLTGAAFLIFALSLRKDVPAAWLVLAGLLALPIFASRVRMRPEMFTLPMLMAAVVLVDGVRRGWEPRKLWWLVPMMLTWVNMHGLYFLGLIVMWGGFLGAALDRLLSGRAALAGRLPTQAALAPILAATAACLVSPWPLESLLHPLRLWSRISGEAFYYTFGVSEFRPTYQFLSIQPEMVLLVSLTVLVLALNARKVPAAHLFWLLPFMALAMLAMRNVALLGPVCGLLLAVHGGALLRRIAAAKPPLARAGPWASAVLFLTGIAISAGYATEYLYRLRAQGSRTGAGLCPNYYVTGLARYLGELKAPGDVFTVNFGDASAFIYYSFPARKVWMDGRLEIRSLARFAMYCDLSNDLRTADGADHVTLPPRVRFVVVPCEYAEHLTSLMQSRRFRLVRLEATGACFAWAGWRDDRPGPGPAEPLPDRPNLEDFDRPLEPNGLVQGTPVQVRRWYRQNPHSALFKAGTLMLSLGQTPAGWRNEPNALAPRLTLVAMRHLAASAAEDIVRRDAAEGTLAAALLQWVTQTGQEAADAAPIDVDLARALWLHSRHDLPAIPGSQRMPMGRARIACLLQGRHLDAAMEAVNGMTKALPPMEQLFPSREYLNMRNSVRGQLELAQADLLRENLDAMPLLERVRALTTPQRGMTLEAIRQLRAAPDLDASGRMALADLLLRLGRAAEARKEYQAAQTKGADSRVMQVRLALCEWVEGNLYAALDMFNIRGSIQSEEERRIFALAGYYKGLLLEELGLYDRARDCLREAAGLADPALGKLIEQARARL